MNHFAKDFLLKTLPASPCFLIWAVFVALLICCTLSVRAQPASPSATEHSSEKEEWNPYSDQFHGILRNLLKNYWREPPKLPIKPGDSPPYLPLRWPLSTRERDGVWVGDGNDANDTTAFGPHILYRLGRDWKMPELIKKADVTVTYSMDQAMLVIGAIFENKSLLQIFTSITAAIGNPRQAQHLYNRISSGAEDPRTVFYTAAAVPAFIDALSFYQSKEYDRMSFQLVVQAAILAGDLMKGVKNPVSRYYSRTTILAGLLMSNYKLAEYHRKKGAVDICLSMITSANKRFTYAYTGDIYKGQSFWKSGKDQRFSDLLKPDEGYFADPDPANWQSRRFRMYYNADMLLALSLGYKLNRELGLTKDAERILEKIQCIYNFLERNVRDKKFGGYYFEWSKEGRPSKRFPLHCKLTYGNAMLGWSMMIMHQATGDDKYKQRAERIIRFLMDKMYIKDSHGEPFICYMWDPHRGASRYNFCSGCNFIVLNLLYEYNSHIPPLRKGIRDKKG